MVNNVKDETYYFHQTPEELAKKLITLVPLVPGDNVVDTFRGEGAFYNNFPAFVNKGWAEITEGQDFRNYNQPIDWIITNPPFTLKNEQGKNINAFWEILKYYSTRSNKGICFLSNAKCFSSLTPKRMKELKALGWHINKMTVCNIKKWSGRYYFIQFTKVPNDFTNFLDGVF